MVRVRWGACGAAGAAARTRRARVGGCRGGGLLGRRRAVQIDRGAGSCRRRRAAACQGPPQPRPPRRASVARPPRARQQALSCRGRYLRLCDGAICELSSTHMLAVVAGSHPGPPPARPQGAIGAARGGAGAALGAAERGARAPCNSWSVRSASCQGLVPPSIASGARCDGIDRGCKGQQQRGAEAVRKATKEANAGVTGERYMWRQCCM
ncbi:MAG: hypothetical protein J3K34DRAFT_415384 [Monoraphidium minutum]|nr:MAG: hypothetical protein J3K34DRAFT_448537 [Monoraphidium minutum]KAI8472004.1 MAG: hypothetical protein J3K34DRAFT_415384 [Monoraphidium minutum]